MNAPKSTKPLLRGYLHQEAFFVSLGVGIVMMAQSRWGYPFLASAIYVLGLLLMFGISAIYHRPHWQPKQRAFMKRLDHSSIFIQIASTFTPLCLLALPSEVGNRLLIIIWSVALLGILQSIFWVKAPKYVTALLYVAMGWIAFPYMSDWKNTLAQNQILFLLLGGITHTVGAVFYALKKPNIVSGVFGYHELFHLFTIIGTAFFYIVIYQLVLIN